MKTIQKKRFFAIISINLLTILWIFFWALQPRDMFGISHAIAILFLIALIIYDLSMLIMHFFIRFYDKKNSQKRETIYFWISLYPVFIIMLIIGWFSFLSR